MPTYEYACRDCGTHVEVFQRFGEDALKECGLCRGELRKVFHPAGIVFKGSGFYATDSRASKGSASGDGAKEAKDAKPSDTKASKPTETKDSKGTDAQTSKPSEAPAAKEKTA